LFYLGPYFSLLSLLDDGTTVFVQTAVVQNRPIICQLTGNTGHEKELASLAPDVCDKPAAAYRVSLINVRAACAFGDSDILDPCTFQVSNIRLFCDVCVATNR